MKLLLTSAGIINKSLQRVLKSWVKNEEMRIAFIPTAANVEEGNKEWLISDYNNCLKLGSVDIVDISALSKRQYLPRLRVANIIFMGGGNTIHLMKWIIKSGLEKELPELLKTRIYVGISAGSCVMSKNLNASSEYLYGDESKKETEGLGYVNFNIRPHLNSKNFPKVRDSELKKVVKKLKGDTYAIDDNSAVVFDNGKIHVVSEGKWKLYKGN
jgi:dipeptidase E